MKSPLRRRVAAVALVLSAPLAAACTDGFGAQTDQPYQPAVGVSNQDGTLDALNALIVSGSDGSGTLAVSFVNDANRADALTGVSGQGISASFSPIDLPSDQLVNIVAPGSTPVTVTGKDVVAGNFVTLELAFRNSEPKTMQVPVVKNTGEFTDVPLQGQSGSSSSPSASPSASPSE